MLIHLTEQQHDLDSTEAQPPQDVDPHTRNQDLLDWLLSCPEKDFFVPIESESTDTL